METSEINSHQQESENIQVNGSLPKICRCSLSDANSDFELILFDGGYKVKTRQEAGFQWLWKSAKTNYGVTNGKYMFEARITQFLDCEPFTGNMSIEKNEFTTITMDDPLFPQRYLCRVGWSTYTAKSNIGSDFEGVAYDNQGYKIYGGMEKTFGESYAVGDVIRCCIDLKDTYTISYYKNGEFLGAAYKIPKGYNNKHFYPHICLKNMAVEFNFGQSEEYYPIHSLEEKHDNDDHNNEENSQNINKHHRRDDDHGIDLKKYKVNIQEYEYIGFAKPENMEVVPDTQKNFKNCLMVMMVGLPCSGKTTYALRYAHKNLEKNFTILGTYEIFDHILNSIRMRALKLNIIALMEICNEIFEKTLKIAAKIPKNFIIDQCNIFLKNRIEKLALFQDFRKEALVLVLTEAEQKKRISKKEKYMNKYNVLVPKICLESLRFMTENFILPEIQEGFDKIHYVELDEDTAQKVVLLSNEIARLQVHPLLREHNYKDIREIFQLKNSKYKSTDNIISEYLSSQSTDSTLLKSNFSIQQPPVNLRNTQQQQQQQNQHQQHHHHQQQHSNQNKKQENSGQDGKHHRQSKNQAKMQNKTTAYNAQIMAKHDDRNAYKPSTPQTATRAIPPLGNVPPLVAYPQLLRQMPYPMPNQFLNPTQLAAFQNAYLAQSVLAQQQKMLLTNQQNMLMPGGIPRAIPGTGYPNAAIPGYSNPALGGNTNIGLNNPNATTTTTTTTTTAATTPTTTQSNLQFWKK